jgi:surfeit locus 1 family protein
MPYAHLASEQPRRPPSAAARFFFAVLALFLFCVFAALGSWQVRRLQWKQALIARVEARVNAPAVPAPPRARWSGISAASDEYRHVALQGSFLYAQTARVQAVTELGAGFWLLTPMCTTDGIVFVNRGFVPVGPAPAPAPPAPADACANAGPRIALTGLLRIGEPGGGFLRRNDPAATTAGIRAMCRRWRRRAACAMRRRSSSMRKQGRKRPTHPAGRLAA